MDIRAPGGRGFSFADPVFYARPYITLRGVPAVRYQRQHVVQTELEARWQFWKRFSAVVFGGALFPGTATARSVTRCPLARVGSDSDTSWPESSGSTTVSTMLGAPKVQLSISNSAAPGAGRSPEQLRPETVGVSAFGFSDAVDNKCGCRTTRTRPANTPSSKPYCCELSICSAHGNRMLFSR